MLELSSSKPRATRRAFTNDDPSDFTLLLITQRQLIAFCPVSGTALKTLLLSQLVSSFALAFVISSSEQKFTLSFIYFQSSTFLQSTHLPDSSPSFRIFRKYLFFPVAFPARPKTVACFQLESLFGR